MSMSKSRGDLCIVYLSTNTGFFSTKKIINTNFKSCAYASSVRARAASISLTNTRFYSEPMEELVMRLAIT